MLIETEEPRELTDMLQPDGPAHLGCARRLRAGILRGNDRVVPAQSHPGNRLTGTAVAVQRPITRRPVATV